MRKRFSKQVHVCERSMWGVGHGGRKAPVVRGIVRQTASSNYRFSAIVQAIVKSPPFTMRLKVAPAAGSGNVVAAR
jgi:hypothetical protein